MKSFACNETGDVMMMNGEIGLAQGEELLCQKARALLASGKGEWWLNETEGMNQQVLLGKNPEEAKVRDEMGRTLLALGENMVVTKFIMEQKGRDLMVHFAAEMADGQNLSATVTGGREGWHEGDE